MLWFRQITELIEGKYLPIDKGSVFISSLYTRNQWEAASK